MKNQLWLLTVCALLLYHGSALALTRIKLGIVAQTGSPQNMVAEKFKERIEQVSNDNFSVQIVHFKSVGNEAEILQQLQTNMLQMGIVTAGSFDRFDPAVRVINYPFLFKDHEQADKILDGPLGAKILKSIERSGFKGLCFSENGFINLTNNRRPVKNPTDIKGLKIRVIPSALHQFIWQALGAEPVPMPWPIYTGLERGFIDGQESPIWVIEANRFYDVQRFLTLTRHVYSPHINTASIKWWTALDNHERDLIQRTIHEAAVFQRKDHRSKNADRLELLKQKGMQIEMHPDIDAFRSKAAGLKDIDLYSEPRVQALLIEFLNATQ